MSRFSPGVSVLVLALMLTALAMPGGAPPRTPLDLTWYQEVVDSDGLVGAYASIGFLQNGTEPAFAYQDYGENDLRFAFWNVSGWTVELVDSSDWAGFSPSLRTDAGRTTISYLILDPPYKLRFAERIGGVWHHQTVWSGGPVASSMAVGPDGTRYIAFGAGSSGLLLASETVTGWNFTTIDSSVPGVAGVSLSIRGEALAIGYTFLDPNGTGVAKIASGSGGAWEIRTLATGTGSSVSVAINSTGRPHLAFGIEERLAHAYPADEGWVEETVDRGTGVGDIHIYLSLAIGSDDAPRVAYLVGDIDNYRLMYAVRGASSWLHSEVTRQLGHGLWVTLGIDAFGDPHLAHLDIGYPTEAGDLWHATTQPRSSRNVSLRVEPRTLNVRSQGQWVNAQVAVENATSSDVNLTSLALNGVPVVRAEVLNSMRILAKFDRAAFQTTVPVGNEVEVTLTGTWTDGQSFRATDRIRIIDPGNGHGKP